jgi:TolB-like protein/tetratricopeptide (TPR) repeat protein
VAAVAVGLGIAWIVLKSLQWAAAPTPQPPGQFATSEEPKSPVSVIPEKSIVVLPFDNLSSDPEQEYFSDGLTEEIITDLSHIGELLVISRNSAMTFKGTKKKTKEIASEVNVRYVLEGSVRKAGNNLRITAQLIDALTDTHIWAEKFVGTLDDIFDIQEKVSRSIVDALRLRLSPEERNRLFSQPAKSIKAYDLELKSWYYHNRGTLNDFNRALEYSKQALIEDPSYALAYTDVAMCYWVLGNMGYAPAKEMYPLAKTSATRALELDETLAEAHMVLGCYYREFEWDWSSAENEFRRAIQLKPSDSMIHMTYSWHLAFTNRHEESIAEMRKALECDPLYVWPAASIGEVLLLAKKSDLAIEQCLKVIERDPEFYMTYWLLGTAYLQKDQNLKAVEAFSKGTIVGERDSSIIAMLGHALGTVGRVHEAREILAELMVRRKESYLSPYWLAMVHIGLGEYDRALDWLQKGYEERAGYMWAIHKYVQFDPLRDNPIFQELCRKMNLIF